MSKKCVGFLENSVTCKNGFRQIHFCEYGSDKKEGCTCKNSLAELGVPACVRDELPKFDMNLADENGNMKYRLQL